MLEQLMKQKEQDYEEVSNKIYGVVTATVTNTKDPDQKGRIKVKYEWMGEAKAIESDWARVVSFMAGNARGAHFLPDVKDEVLVAFEHGNINYPYVVGALYNAKDKVIEKNADGKNNIKMIKSRAGHTISLDDSKNAEKFILKDSAGKRLVTFDVKAKSLTIENTEAGDIVIKSKGDVKISSDKNLELSGKSGVKITSSSGDINLEGKNVNIKSKMAMKLEGKSAFTAKSNAAMTLTANTAMKIKGSATCKLEGAKVDVKGSGAATVDGGAMTTIKGGMVKVN